MLADVAFKPQDLSEENAPLKCKKDRDKINCLQFQVLN